MSLRTLAGLVAIGVIAWSSAARSENWPGFRGPTGQGVSTEKNLPTRWSNSENVAWKLPLSVEGWSSPIVFGDHVFITGTSDNGVTCHVLAIHRKRGEVLWDKVVFEQETRRKEGKNSYATPTPVTDGKMVYAVFGGGGLAALDYEGNPQWTYQEIKFYSQHGLGASPILFENLLIMPFDGSSEGPDKKVGWKSPWEKAVILALDKRSGEVVWQTGRGPSRIAHTTPIIWRSPAGPRLLTTAGDVIQGYDAAQGKRLWTAYSQGEGVVPSPVLGDGVVYTASGFEKPTIRAVRLDGQGDVTQTHIVWEQTKGVPSQSSLLYVKPYLYAITDTGVATCFDGEGLDIVWQERIGGNHSASPVYGDGKIYFLSEQGETTVIAAGDKFEEIARNALHEKCQASIAISQGQLFIRTASNLDCIGK